MKVLRNVFVSALVLFSLYALANERFVGLLVNSSGKYLSLVGLSDGGLSGFPIGANALLTVQPTVDMYVCINQKDVSTNAPNCSALNGVRVPANAAFPTSCPSSNNMSLPVSLSDGGTIYVSTNSCIVEVVAVADAGSAIVWQRDGREGF